MLLKPYLILSNLTNTHQDFFQCHQHSVLNVGDTGKVLVSVGKIT